MTNNDVGWELYRSFLAVLEEGSLSGAARALDIAQPTVGRHITALERSLGLALFTRSPTGLLPTEVALEVRAHAAAMQSAAAALKRAASSHGAGVQGVVRVTASNVVGVEVLPPIITGLRERHPGLTIELALTDKVQDLLRREADIAVRMVRPRQGALVARRVGRIELGLHATAHYLERHGVPRTTADLERHAVIGFDRVTPFLRGAAKMLGGIDREMFALRSDSDLAQMALLRAGAGLGFCQLPLARRAGLVRVLPKQLVLYLECWVTMHEGLRNSAHCRATFDALVSGLRRYIGE